MTPEIGHLTLQPAAPQPRTAGTRPAGRTDAPVRVQTVDHRDISDVIPASPPPEVLAQVDAAFERAARLAAEGRELHFSRDEESRRLIIQVRTLDGEVLRTIPPSHALDVMSGKAL